MYAIIETGNKQYRVKEGDVIDIELLESQKDNKIEFKQVLLLNDGAALKLGKPHIDGCVVHGELIQQVRGPKVISFKYKKRKNYRRKVGHRQNHLRVKITDIKG